MIGLWILIRDALHYRFKYPVTKATKVFELTGKWKSAFYYERGAPIGEECKEAAKKEAVQL